MDKYWRRMQGEPGKGTTTLAINVSMQEFEVVQEKAQLR